MQILLLNTMEGEGSNLNAHMTLGLASAFRHWLGNESVKVARYKDLVETAQSFDPNALICHGGGNVRSDILQQIRKLGIPIACWMTEDPFELECNVGNRYLFDHIFSNEESTVTRYGHGRATFLPLCASKVFSHFPTNPTPRYDVCIAGTASSDDVEFCSALTKLLPAVRWKIVLTRIPAPPDFRTPANDVETNLPFSIRDLCRVFNESRIVVTVKRQHPHGKATCGLSPSSRVFETALAGATQLVQTVEGDRIGDYFDAREELATFTSPEECAEKITGLLKDLDRARTMAQRAQERALSQHLFENRAQRIIEWIQKQEPRRARQEPRKRILICARDSSGPKVFGGTEVWTEHLVEHLKQSWQVFILFPYEGKEGFFWRLLDVNRGVWEDEPLKQVDQACSVSAEHELRLKRIILKNEIELVHFQDLNRFPLLISRAVRELGIPYTLSVTDYYPICHKFTLVNNYGLYCHPEAIPIQTCDVCLGATHGYLPGSQTDRRRLMREILGHAKGIICISEFQRELMLQIYPEIEHLVRIVQPTASDQIELGENDNNSTLRVVIPSNFSRLNEADVVLDILKYYQRLPTVQLKILGRIDPEYRAAVNAVSAPNIHVIDGDNREDRIRALRDADIALFLGIWPEACNLTFEEFRRIKIPAIVSDLGQAYTLVKHSVTGWKVSPHDAGAVISILDSLVEDRTPLNQVRENLGKLSLRPYRQDFQEMNAVFEQILRVRKSCENNGVLVARQLKWLTNQLAALHGSETLWAILPLTPPKVQPLTIPEAMLPLASPREAVRRFLAQARRKGLFGAIKVVLEWLSK